MTSDQYTSLMKRLDQLEDSNKKEHAELNKKVDSFYKELSDKIETVQSGIQESIRDNTADVLTALRSDV